MPSNPSYRIVSMDDGVSLYTRGVSSGLWRFLHSTVGLDIDRLCDHYRAHPGANQGGANNRELDLHLRIQI